MQQALRDAYVDDDRSRREVFFDRERRQTLRIAERRRRALRKPERAQCLRRDQRAARRAEEIVERLALRHFVARDLRQGQRLDAEQAIGLVAEADRSLDHGGDFPAGAPKREEGVLREKSAARRDEARRSADAERAGRVVIAAARLIVQRRDAAPQRCGDGKSGEERGELPGRRRQWLAKVASA